MESTPVWFCGVMLAVASPFVCKYSHVLHGMHKPSKYRGVLYQADFLPANTLSVLNPAPRGVPSLLIPLWRFSFVSQTLPNLTHTQLFLLMVKKSWTFLTQVLWGPADQRLETSMAWQLSPSNMKDFLPSDAWYSLPALIRRKSLGLDTWPISRMTLQTFFPCGLHGN